MNRLLIKFLLLMAPFALFLYGPPVYVLLKSGELLSINQIANRRMTEHRQILYGPAYVTLLKTLKRHETLIRSPRTLAIGTSRVMQFRSRFFRTPETFYNAGGAIEELWELRPFFEKIPPGKEPSILIVGLDQYFFNPNWPNLKQPYTDENLGRSEAVVNQWKKIRQDYKDAKFRLRDLRTVFDENEIRIGVNAIINGNGARNDGSHLDGKYIRDPLNPENEDVGFKNTFDRIEVGNYRFEYSRHVSTEALAELDAFLQVAKKRGTHVVCFLPPFAHAVFQRMKSKGENYGYLEELGDALVPLLRKYDFSFFDFSDLASLGSSDEETLDGFHGSEKAYLRLFIKMTDQDPQLRDAAADRGFLVDRLSRSRSPYTVFANDEL